jgi:bile acid:Na+ symporter, BASS family
MEDSLPVVTIALPLALVLIMVSLGMSLTPADFRRVVQQPRGVLIGLGNLLVLSPLLAFGVSEVFGLATVLAVGLVLLGSTPGGTTSNLFTHLARGETAMSVSMTAVSSLLAVITVPLYLGLAIAYFDAPDFSEQVEVLPISLRVFLITIVPLAIGMTIRARYDAWARRNEGRAKIAATTALALVIVVAVIDEFELISDNFTALILATLTFNVLAMGISYAISRAARLTVRQATAVALELGIHNGTLAIAVAATIDLRLAAAAAVYTLPMFVNGAIFARFMSRRNEAAAVSAA